MIHFLYPETDFSFSKYNYLEHTFTHSDPLDCWSMEWLLDTVGLDKILPDKILSRSELGNLAINPIDEVIFSDFSFNWLPMETVKKADLHDESWTRRKQLSGDLKNRYANVSVGASWGENLVWIFLLLGGFAGVFVLINS